MLYLLGFRDELRMDETILLAIAGGVALAWCLNMYVTDNPADIPITRIAVRALPGIGLFFLIGLILSTIFVIVYRHRTPVNRSLGNSRSRKYQ